MDSGRKDKNKNRQTKTTSSKDLSSFNGEKIKGAKLLYTEKYKKYSAAFDVEKEERKTQKLNYSKNHYNKTFTIFQLVMQLYKHLSQFSLLHLP